jgi:putative ABC transport system substrate-binding protein
MLRGIGLASAFTLGLLIAPSVAGTQESKAGKGHQIGWIGATVLAGNADLIAGFQDGLRHLGYEDGKNVRTEFRFADGRVEGLPGLAAELVGLNVDVLVATSTPATVAAKQATRIIPIVMVGPGNPEESGLVASLARPGGNVTGVSGAYGDFATKWVELVREIVPKASRIGYLYNPDNPDSRPRSRKLTTSGRTLGVTIHAFSVTTPSQVEPQLAAVAKLGVHAIVVDPDPVLRAKRKETVEFLARARLPAMYGIQDYVDAGGLMSYGPNRLEMGRRAAVFVDKILKGAKPADLPVEQPTKFALAINTTTAKALGLTLSQTLLLRADELIQ